MLIYKPKLKPMAGYVEDEIDGVRVYRDIKSGEVYLPDELPVEPEEPEAEMSVWDELDAAYTEGVNGAYDE